MKTLILISVACLQFYWTNGEGVGAYAYQDSAGNRYGGTYGLKNNELHNVKGFEDSTFQPVTTSFSDFQDLDNFFPEYFRNLEKCIKEAFDKNVENQRKALDAARKAFDETSNNAGYIPNSGFDRFPSFPNFGFPGSNFGMYGFPGMEGPGNPYMHNSVFSGAAVAPGFEQQQIAINPMNPMKPNIDVMKLTDPGSAGGGPGFYSVQSSSYVSSSNVNGVQHSQKGGETIVNNNGKITKYSLYD